MWEHNENGAIRLQREGNSLWKGQRLSSGKEEGKKFPAVEIAVKGKESSISFPLYSGDGKNFDVAEKGL